MIKDINNVTGQSQVIGYLDGETKLRSITTRICQSSDESTVISVASDLRGKPESLLIHELTEAIPIGEVVDWPEGTKYSPPIKLDFYSLASIDTFIKAASELRDRMIEFGVK